MGIEKNAKRFALGAIIAAAAGYVAGILTAPKSGRETRQDIKDTAMRTYAEAERQLKKLHTELTSLLGKAKDQVADLKGKSQADLKRAIDAGVMIKEKARELLSAIHEGDADDKDLQKAIAEANKAITHLKSYLSKN